MSRFVPGRVRPLVAAIALFASPFAVAETHVFVTNEMGDDVSVIDIASDKVVATIPVGKRPRGIGIAPDGGEIYVAVSGENAIAVIDPKSLEVLRKFDSGPDPETFAVHPNGNLYISNEEHAKASVYDPKTGELITEIKVGLEPEGVAISPDGTRGIVTSESTNMLHLFAIPEHEIIANILVGARPRAAAFSADGKIAYATSEISGEVKKVDVASGKIIGKMPLADDKAKPKDILPSRDGSRLFVAGGRANRVFVLDEKTLEILHEIPVGNRVWGLALSADGKRLYSTDGASDQVSVIDTDANKVVATVPVGKMPWGIVLQ
ncbi:MAG: PQQ-dependent catabolism-associated beta-propeller protein [Gammaproteobacteria bacterium]|nr:PQQ-dependent catabolism-associated beta-propeller protein [Gammaproteobacteria bacterium]